ncbi:hypothetical protein DFH09DRAFT_1119508 [Mycena vulgaris]|nr:hypothetical protein DFH09DRAFT_1119508 [Mycena vulgaris]
MPKPKPKSRKAARDPVNPRALGLEERAKAGEMLKNLGNELFRAGKYAEAAVKYNDAVNIHGTQPVYMSNLAATYLKLEECAQPLRFCSDPRMTKARFRRGMARKESNQLKAAKTDFETILREDPSCAEAQVELAAVQRLCEIHGESDANGPADYEFPAPDHPPRDPLPMWLLEESDSGDSSDSENGDGEHVGNGIPCKHHNRKPLGCAKGAKCVYSHAPDARSMPDNEGRNVCLYFLLGSCKFEDRCLYSHSKANLPDFWGDEFRIPEVRDLIYQNELAIRDRRLFTKYMGKGPLASDTLLAVKRQADAAGIKKARKAGTFLRMLETFEAEPPASAPFIMHLTLNKSTNVPRDTVDGLRARVEVSRAKTKKKALGKLASPALVGVLITDAGITLDNNAGLLAKLAAYARAGGTVVLGGSFKLFKQSAQVDVPDAQLAAFFREGWGVAWRRAVPCSGPLALNARHALADAAGASLPRSYGTAGLHLTGVRADAALYVSTAGVRPSDLVETPVVFAQFGKGHLGFVGDAGAERAATDVIAAMFRLSSSATA